MSFDTDSEEEDEVRVQMRNRAEKRKSSSTLRSELKLLVKDSFFLGFNIQIAVSFPQRD